MINVKTTTPNNEVANTGNDGWLTGSALNDLTSAAFCASEAVLINKPATAAKYVFIAPCI